MKMYSAYIEVYLDEEFLKSIYEEEGSLPDWARQYHVSLNKHYACNDLDNVVMLALADFFNQEEVRDLEINPWEYNLEEVENNDTDGVHMYVFTSTLDDGRAHNHIEVYITEHVFKREG